MLSELRVAEFLSDKTYRQRKDHELRLVILGDASPEYRAGWAFGDVWCDDTDADLNADAAPHWSDEKCEGFWDRLSYQRAIKAGKGGSCNVCRTYTRLVWNCGKDSCIPF